MAPPSIGIGIAIGIGTRPGGNLADNPADLDLFFAADKAFTKDPAVAAGTLLTARTGPPAAFARQRGHLRR